MRSLVFMVAAAVIACGPSAAELKTAKTAMYVGNADEIFKIIVETTAETYKVADAQGHSETEVDYELITQPQWYNPEGGRQSSGEGGYVQVVDRSVQLALVVTLTEPEPRRFLVTVTPKTFQHISGSPKPRELSPEDPNLPGWVQGRVDSLYVEIHKRLQNYATK